MKKEILEELAHDTGKIDNSNIESIEKELSILSENKAKWLRRYIEGVKIVDKKTIEYNKLYAEKYKKLRYGAPSEEDHFNDFDYNEREVKIFLGADEELNSIKNSLNIYKSDVEYLEKALSTLEARGYDLKAIIELVKWRFENGER